MPGQPFESVQDFSAGICPCFPALVCDGRMTFGDGPGLVENYSIDFFRDFKACRILDQDSVFGSLA